MTRGRKPKIYEDEDEQIELIEEDFRGRAGICTCELDPDYCEKCNQWG